MPIFKPASPRPQTSQASDFASGPFEAVFNRMLGHNELSFSLPSDSRREGWT